MISRKCWAIVLQTICIEEVASTQSTIRNCAMASCSSEWLNRFGVVVNVAFVSLLFSHCLRVKAPSSSTGTLVFPTMRTRLSSMGIQEDFLADSLSCDSSSAGFTSLPAMNASKSFRLGKPATGGRILRFSGFNWTHCMWLTTKVSLSSIQATPLSRGFSPICNRFS